MNSKHIAVIALALMLVAIPAIASAYAIDDGFENKYVPVNITADLTNSYQMNSGTLTVISHGGGSIRDNVVFIHNMADKDAPPLNMGYYMDGTGGEAAFNQSEHYKPVVVMANGQSLPVSLAPGVFSWTLRVGNGDQPEFGTLSIVPGGNTVIVIQGDAMGRARAEVGY